MPGAVDELVSMLDWCGVSHDEGPHRSGGDCGPYVQSERLDIYKQHAEQLVQVRARRGRVPALTRAAAQCGCAYRCFCSVARLEKLRDAAYKRGSPVVYDRKCCALSASDVQARLANNEPHTIRLLVSRWPDGRRMMNADQSP